MQKGATFNSFNEIFDQKFITNYKNFKEKLKENEFTVDDLKNWKYPKELCILIYEIFEIDKLKLVIYDQEMVIPQLVERLLGECVYPDEGDLECPEALLEAFDQNHGLVMDEIFRTMV